MTEQIGKIILDYKYYPGEDFYCDGEVEDELLDIVKRHPPSAYQKVIEEQSKWPVLYHLSPLRENIVDWIPMEKSAKVLEVGAGCGAITGKLAQKAGSVTSIDLSKKRSLINAYRHKDCDNVTIHVGNFGDIEPTLPSDFDYICLIGVFEYGQSYTGTAQPYDDLLKMLKRHLKEDGRIIIAIENKLGLKYFAGCKEDHLGTYFSGIEDYAQGDGVRTFSRNGLEHIFKRCGVENYSFYYPYPDYKFMTAIYSDARLPKQGELTENLRNFDRDRMLLFDEKSVFDGMIKDELFPVFSNSYVAVIGNEFGLKYAKYSNDRALEYAIRTEISIDENNNKIVRKTALSEEAAEHITNMETAYKELSKRFKGSSLQVNKCALDMTGTSIEFEFVEGMTLEEILDAYLESGRTEQFHLLFQEYLQRISYHEEQPVADYDLIFPNIIISPAVMAATEERASADSLDLEEITSAVWTIIDYEWTFGKAVTGKETAFRAIYCYLLENEKRSSLNLDAIMEILGVTEKEAEFYREQEMEFQKTVTGSHKSMAEMRDAIGYQVMEPRKWVHKFDDSSQKERIQVYEDRGRGYNEADSYFVKDAYESETVIALQLEIDDKVSMLRIDPAMDYCVVRIQELLFNEEKIKTGRKNIVTNGKTLKDGSYVFATDDPNINIRLINLDKKAENTLTARIEVIRITEEIANDLTGAVKKIF